MKLIYAFLPLCLLAACKQTSTSTPEQGQVANPANPPSQTMNDSSDKPDPKPEAKPESKPQDKPDAKLTAKPKPKPKPVGDARYIGMTKEAAAALAKKEGVPSRIVSEDGQVRMLTMDHRPERLNFTVVAGKVTKVTHG